MAKKLTQEELSGMIDKGLGTLLTPPEVDKRKKTGELPENFKVEEGFGVYRIDVGGNEYLCVTNILCDKCQRINGKVKRCDAHKRKRKGRKGKKDGDVVDDMSDREKLTGLRHVNDDEDDDDKIDGAFTPDAVMTPGIGGAIIIVPVDARNNDRAGPPAKGLNHVKGVLVRGAGNIPQFIPNDRLTKAHKLRYDNYIEGELNMILGKEIFVPNNLGAAKMDGKNSQEVAKAAVADKVDVKIVELIGKDMVVAVQVDVADNGMPVMKVLEGKPKDKETAVGIIVKTNDDQIQFVQIAGKELGGGKDAKMMPCTIPENAKVGDVVADIYIDANGKAVAAKPGEVPAGGQIIGQVVVGQNDQLVFVPKGENKDDVIKKCAKMTPEMKEKLEQAQCKVQAAVTGQSADHIQGQVNRIGEPEAAAAGASGGNQGGGGGGGSGAEVRSVGFGAQQFGGSQFARPSPAGGGSGGGGGGGNNGKQYVNGEVRSVAFGAQGAGGSVFAKPSGTGGGYSAGGGAGGGGGKTGGGGGGGASGGGGEVRSVAMGGNQYGASVFAKGGAGASGGAGGAGGGKNAGGKKGNNTGGSSGADVQSVGFGAQQYGASVFMKK